MGILLTLMNHLGSIASGVLSVAACITLFAKPIRKKFISWIESVVNKETKEQFDEMLNTFNKQIEALMKEIEQYNKNDELKVEALRSLLRNSITHVYYKNEGTKTLRQYEAELVFGHFKIYFSLGGNSYIETLYKEMVTWKIIK